MRPTLLALSSATLLLPIACDSRTASSPPGSDSQLQEDGVLTPEDLIGGEETPSVLEIDTLEQASKTLFSLADYARQTPVLAKVLAPLIAPGSAHLDIGDKGRFALQTNVELESVVSKGFQDKSSGFIGSFWADAFVFHKQVGGAKQGSLVDIGIESNERTFDLLGRIRFLGVDKLAGTLSSKVEKLLTRDLSGEAVVYGSELLGVKVGGNVGGEIGLAADLDRNLDESLVMGFLPRAGLNSGLTGKVEALKFARAEVAGIVGLIDSNLVTQGTMGALRRLGLLVGDVGMDSGVFQALDGKVVIGASAGLDNGLLPAGVDPTLWVKVDQRMQDLLKQVTTRLLQWRWVHVLWDPTPLLVSDLPEFTKPFLTFTDKPQQRDVCLARYGELKAFVDQMVAGVQVLAENVAAELTAAGEGEQEKLESRLRVLATVKTNYRLIQSEMHRYCSEL